MAHPEIQLTADQLASLEASLQRLLDGEALPYVLGEWEFYGRTFTVTPQVLIPRPETELMIEYVISWCKEHEMTTPQNASVEAGSFVCADVGTGSGCVAISLALEVPGTHFIATDISLQALQTARLNVIKHDVQEQVELVHADLLSAFAPSSFNILCANLPYIPSARLPHLAVATHEPLLALDGGPNGLDLIARLIPQASRLLTSCGLALLEIDDTHTDAVLELAEKSFNGSSQVINDYQEKPRLLKLEKCLDQG